MNRNPRLTVGDSGGKVNIFELADVISRPPPAARAANISSEATESCCRYLLSITCPGCNLIFNLSTVPAHAIKFVRRNVEIIIIEISQRNLH